MKNYKEVQLNKFILIQECLQNAHNVEFVSWNIPFDVSVYVKVGWSLTNAEFLLQN